ncbi:MAG TPA: substrate-binding domain-containing protein [Acidimicrobiales bacterium]|nr:substrate-binding domain-containing protein [Acidimicrobiales bacterium]
MDRKHRSAARWPRFFAAAAAGTVVLSFATITTASGSSSVPLANPFGYKYGYKAAVAELAKLYAGTSTAVNTTPRPAAKNKSIVIISSGQASISSSIPVDAAQAAAEKIGWNVTILDGKLMPSTYGGLISQAIALNPAGIILDAVDCNQARGPLQQAKAHHIAVVPLYAYDCNDPTENAGPPLFSAVENFNNLPAKELGYFAESYGRGQADYIIAATHNKARVLVLNDEEFTVLKYTAAGFDDQIAHSGGSQVVATLNFLSADLGPKLQQEVQAELLQHPDINWIKSPYTYATILGVTPALTAYPKGKFSVMGGEGFQPELQDIQQGTVTAAMAISSTWTGWAAVDTMNSVLTHKPVYESGIGWQLINSTHNLPANAQYSPPQNFEAAYLKAWGIKK